MYQAIYCDKKRELACVWDDVNGLVMDKYIPYAYAKDGSGGGEYTTIYGDKVSKTTKFFYGEHGLFESDVPWETRTLIDAYGDSDEVSTNHTFLFIDIEVKTEGEYPKVDTAKQPITAIAFYSSTDKVYTCFVLDDKTEIDAHVEFADAKVVTFKDENALLIAFINEWVRIAPTVVSGWNSNGFDLPYLNTRIRKVLRGNWVEKLSPIGIVFFNERKNQVTIAGVNCLDYLPLYKKYEMKPLPNYRLDTVAKEELGIGKVQYEGSLNELKRTDVKKFIQYNIHDVKLVVMLDEVKRFIMLAMSICHVCHVGYEDFSVTSIILEGALLTYLRRKGLVAPDKPKKLSPDDYIDSVIDDSSDDTYDPKDTNSDKDTDTFTGAYVKEPVPGRYNWVTSTDINSLYPSVIMSLNISPETKLGVIPNWNPEAFAKKKLTTVRVGDTDMAFSDFMEFINRNNISISANGVLYDQSKLGCVPEILKKWFAERVEYKTKMKDCANVGDKEGEVFWKRRQHVQKILLNSLYGALGLNSFRFFDLDNALAVTSTGQEIIKTSAKLINAELNEKLQTVDNDYVIYIDTDSLYIAHRELLAHDGISTTDVNVCKQYCAESITRLSNLLNDFYAVMMPRMFNCTNPRIRILPDVVASSAIWIRKKRYAMRKIYNMETGKDKVSYEYKGLDIVRSSFPAEFRALLSKIVNSILDGNSKATIDDTIVSFKDNIDSLDVAKIAKNTSVRFESGENAKEKRIFNPANRYKFNFVDGATAQCKAALAYNDFLTHFNLRGTEPILSGGKIKWVYLEKNPFNLTGLAFKDDGRDPVEIMDYINQYVSRQKMWDKEFKKKIDAFYLAMNWGEFSQDIQLANNFFLFDSE